MQNTLSDRVAFTGAPASSWSATCGSHIPAPRPPPKVASPGG